MVLFQLLLLTKKRRSQSGGAPVSYTYALVGKVMRSTHYMRSTFIGFTLKLFSVLVRLRSDPCNISLCTPHFLLYLSPVHELYVLAHSWLLSWKLLQIGATDYKAGLSWNIVHWLGSHLPTHINRAFLWKFTTVFSYWWNGCTPMHCFFVFLLTWLYKTILACISLIVHDDWCRIWKIALYH